MFSWAAGTLIVFSTHSPVYTGTKPVYTIAKLAVYIAISSFTLKLQVI